MTIKHREWVSVGTNPARFIGARYSTKCNALARLKGDHRPMLTIYLVWATVWVQLPWRHSDHRKGWTIGRSWGAVVSLGQLPLRSILHWGN